MVADEMKFGDQIPSGTYLDMAANLPLVDPKKVLSPVLMVRGEFDGNSTNEDLLDFYRAASERRSPVRHPAAHRAQHRLEQQSSSALLRVAQLPRRAGTDRGLGTRSLQIGLPAVAGAKHT